MVLTKYGNLSHFEGLIINLCNTTSPTVVIKLNSYEQVFLDKCFYQRPVQNLCVCVCVSQTPPPPTFSNSCNTNWLCNME